MGLTSQLHRDAKPPPAQQNKGKRSEGIPEAVFVGNAARNKIRQVRKPFSACGRGGNKTCGVNLCHELLLSSPSLETHR